MADTLFGFIRDINERKQAARIKDQLRNYLTDPDSTITAINQIDPATGIALNNQRRTEQAAQVGQSDKVREQQLGAFTKVTGFLRSLPEGSDYGKALDDMSPFLTSTLGMTPESIATARQTILAQPGIINMLDDEARKLAGQTDVISPGSAYAVGGKVVYRNPTDPKVLQVPNASGGRDVITVDPNRPPIGTPGTGTGVGNLSVDSLRPHFVAQESGGDYGARNTETGALGAYQVMPDTGRSLAKRLGLAWRPDMMRGTDPTSRRYQDAIGGAAIQEAVEASGGDPATAFSYYYGGADRSRWGPKTRKYRDEMLNRTGGGGESQAGGGAASPVYSTSGPAKPDKSMRTLTPQEIAANGLPEGTAAQIDANGGIKVLSRPPAGLQSAGVKRMEAYRTSQGRVNSIGDGLDDMISAATAISRTPSIDSYLGNVQGRLPSWMSGGRNDFNLQVEALRTKIGLNALQQMREMSKTGGALGQVSNYENRMLQQSIDSLDSSQSEAQFKRNLANVIKYANRAKMRMGQALERDFAGMNSERPAAPAGKGAPPVGTRRRNPQTGAQVEFNGRGWVPVR